MLAAAAAEHERVRAAPAVVVGTEGAALARTQRLVLLVQQIGAEVVAEVELHPAPLVAMVVPEW